jgi:5-methylcytosine-specific restriction endonuclease McrA
MTYEEQLLDPRWKIKRDHIIERDFGICQICMSSKNLHVHHKVYIQGKMAWEYPDYHLLTLCAKCHEHYHDTEKVNQIKEGEDMISIGQRMRNSVRLLKRLIKW